MSHADVQVEVDDYLVETLVPEDEALVAARESAQDTTMPGAAVAPNQGKLLALLTEMIGAHRVLEFGTLAGYSTIWLARAVGPQGRVVTLEVSEQNAGIARRNADAAGVGDVVEIMLGPAGESADRIIETGQAPFDLVFIDADKPNNARYLQAALELTRPGSVIVLDNVVRAGRVADQDSTDDDVRGVRDALALAAADPRLDGTALQTVGSKGWDGFALFRRVS
ncbi:O-methyltransferase [Ruania halotolerans]|uniref:O-methyltransferase n=1 Tax=Ruania halotolerans TaxID=2897773 RepID=UPI001E494A3D|nr:O-methyltransferase [Ruania halotolerans]UFU06633.1 O-methyltransferase [Ruania halotolerans]